MKKTQKIILAFILFLGGISLYGQTRTDTFSGREKLRDETAGTALDIFIKNSKRSFKHRENVKLADGLNRLSWTIFNYENNSAFLIGNDVPGYYLGEVDKVDLRLGLCYRHGNGILRVFDTDGGAFHYLGSWKRDMIHGLVIYREAGSTETMAAQYKYDNIKKKTIRPATPEETAALDEAINKIDSTLASLDDSF